MIIKLNTSDRQQLDKLIEMKYCNILAADLYNEYLTNYFDSITQEDISKLTKKYSMDESFFNAFMTKLEIPNNDKTFKALNENNKIHKMRCLDDMINGYKNNLYYRNIDIKSTSFNNWHLNKQFYLSYEAFVYDEIIDDENNYYSEHTPFGFFTKKLFYPSIIHKNCIWMCITPHEINTMRKPIEDCKGNVLVLGAGLLYFPYMISKKKDISNITIIENDKNVIKILEENILPQFGFKKINIICEDAYNYLDNNDLSLFDNVFIDIYHDAFDGLDTYLKILKYDEKYPSTSFIFWIEKSILLLLRRYVISIIEDSLYQNNSDSDEDSIIYKNVKKYLRTYEFSSYEEIYDFLSIKNLKNLAKKISLC